MILPRISPLPRVNLRGELGIQRARCHVIPFQRNVTRPATPLRALPKRAGVRRACRACPSCPGASPFWPATMPPSSPGRAVSAGSRTALAGGPRRFNRRPQRLERKALQLRSAALSPRPTAPPAWDGAGGGLGGALPAPISPPRRGQGPFGSPKDPPPSPLPPLPTPRPRQLAQAAYGADAIFMPDVQGATYTNRLRTYYACVLRFAPPPTVAHRPAARSGAPARRMAAVAAVASASAPASTTADPIRRASHQGSTGPAHLPQQVSHPRVRACHDLDDNAPGQTSGGAVGLHCPIRSDRQRSKGRPCACASVRSSTASCEYVQRMRVCYCICCVAHACGCAFLHERASERREFRCCALSM